MENVIHGRAFKIIGVKLDLLESALFVKIRLIFHKVDDANFLADIHYTSLVVTCYY